MKILLVLCAACPVFGLSVPILTSICGQRLSLQKRVASLAQENPHTIAQIPVHRKKSALQKIFGKENTKIIERLGDELYLAGIALRPEEFVAIWATTGLLIPVTARILKVNLIVVIGLVVLGSALPVVFVKTAKAKSMKQFDRQLLDALTILCNSLRAGFSFQTAMDNISREMPDPIAREFKRVVRECNMGMSLDDSLERLVQRTANEDLSLIVSAVLIQKQVGGNLAQVLDNISGTIQQRIKLRGDIKVLTSSGTMSGYIIGLLPVVMLLTLMIFNPAYVEDFFASTIGRAMLGAAVVMEALGFYFVHKVVNIKF